MNENFIKLIGDNYYCIDLDKYDLDTCPMCGGDVTKDTFMDEWYGEPDNHEITFYRRCEHCDFEWTEVFKLDRVFYHTDNN